MLFLLSLHDFNINEIELQTVVTHFQKVKQTFCFRVSSSILWPSVFPVLIPSSEGLSAMQLYYNSQTCKIIFK